FQLASVTAGGPAPILAVILLREFGTSMAIAAYISICAVISLACVCALRERSGTLDHQCPRADRCRYSLGAGGRADSATPENGSRRGAHVGWNQRQSKRARRSGSVTKRRGGIVIAGGPDS